MTAAETSQSGRPPVFDLDPGLIGQVFARLPALACSMSHADIYATLNPYCNHPAQLSPEARFVYDVLSLPLNEVIDTWYGGRVEASHLIATAMAQVLAE